MRLATGLAVVAAAFGVAGCSGESPPSPSIPAAPPQVATLDWVEAEPAKGPALVFGVRELRVTDRGWQADISIENRTAARFEIPPAVESSDRAFGLMLFIDGELSTLEEQSRRGTTPPVRVAQQTTPATPEILAPGATWRGTISAPGRLQSGAYVRVSFGPLEAVDDPPDGIPGNQFSWITDHAYRLR